MKAAATVMSRGYRTGLFIVLLLQAIAEPGQFDGIAEAAPVVPEEKKVSPVPVIVIGVAVAGTGAGAYFLIRRTRRERRTADSVIALVEKAWQRSSSYYANEEYREAVRGLQEISAIWYDYERYSARYRKHRRVHPDSIRSVIASCDFLEKMIPLVSSLSREAEGLPADEFALSKMSRYEVMVRKSHLQTAIDSIEQLHPNHLNGLQYSFRHITRKLRSVDSLIAVSYDDRKADFSFKNRYYYNRAVEDSDTAALRRFVADCDYYQVDKEWCQRARLALEEPGAEIIASSAGSSPGGKMSVADSIEVAFKQAMQSKRIEVLEAYIQKYSSRRYRSRRRSTKINEVKAALRQLRAEIEKELAFNKIHPRFGNGDFRDILLTVKGVSGATEAVFRHAWNSLEHDVSKLPSIRFPAALSIDYTSKPPLILLDAVISAQNDVERNVVNNRSAYRLIGLIPTMQLLNRFKQLSLSMIGTRSYGGAKKDGVTDFLQKKVGAAMYALRLHSSDGTGTILFYAREPDEGEVGVRFYDFYDLAINDKGKRFPIYPGSLPNIIPSLSSDPLEQRMGTEFFGE
ncbi:MAG: hypothetical protein JW863_10775 [Chitinispirillaceae bacterium]|nr:hypothetical protein [Chitinispirillaceae bacterium]